MKRSLPVLLSAALITGFSSHAEPVFGLFLGREYFQLGTFSMLNPQRTAYWESWVQGFDTNQLQQAQVRTPSGASVTLPRNGSGAYLTKDFASESARASAYPNGNYQLDLTRTDASVAQVNLTQSTASYPGVPVLDASQILQQLPAGVGLELRFQPAADALETDVIVASLIDGNGGLAFTTPFPGQAGALSGRANRALIPGAILQPLSGFMVRLTAYRAGTLETLPDGAGKRVVGRCSTVMTTLTVSAERGGELAEYCLLRGQSFEQNGDAAPLPCANSPFFAASARGIFANHITHVTVESPNGKTIPLQDLDTPMWGWQTNFPDESSLLAAFPNGPYAWKVLIDEGPTQRVTNILSSVPMPAPLQILDWQRLQTNSLTNDVVVRWALPAGARAEDQIELLILNGDTVVFRAPNLAFGEPLIPGTVTQLVIPADTLNTYARNQARLRYLRVGQVDTNSLPEATGLVGACAETRFVIGTLDAWPLEILTTELAPTPIGRRCVAPITTAGGRKPFTWSIATGQLPAGMSFDPQLPLISGTPLVLGDFPLTLQVVDSLGNLASQSLTLSVTGQLERVEIANTNLPPVIDGIFYVNKMRSRGGVAPQRWSIASGRLPQGMECDPASGMIYGLAEEAGVFPLELEVEDLAGQVARRNFELQVPSADHNPRVRFRTPVLTGLGHVELNVSARAGTLCTIETSTDLKSWQPCLVTNVPSGGKLDLGARQGSARFYRLYQGAPPPVPDPLIVLPVVGTNLAVTAPLTSAGVSLALTNPAEQIWRLEIPANAAFGDATIRMTPLLELWNLPAEAGFLGGVQLEPEGLMLRTVGQLTVTFPGQVPETFAGFGYEGGGEGLHLYPVVAGSNTVSFPIQHFSGYGGVGVDGNAKNSMNQRLPCVTRSQVASRLSSDTYLVIPLEILEEVYTSLIEPKLKEARQDDTRITEVEEGFLYWESMMRDAMASPAASQPQTPPAELLDQGWQELGFAYHSGINQALLKCVKEHRPWRMMRAYELLDRATEIGLNEHTAGKYPNLSESVLFEDFKNYFRFELEIISTIEATADGGGYFKSGVLSEKAEFVPKQRPVVKHSFDAFEESTAELSNIAWELREKKNRVKPIYEKGTLGAVSLGLAGLNWPQKSDSCGHNVPAWGDPTETRIACQFDAADPVPKMKVRDAKGVWREGPCTTWWIEFKLAHAFEVLVFTDGSGSRREVVKPKESKWEYAGGETFATADYSGSPEGTAGAKGGTITEETLIKLHHAPK